MPDVLVLHPTEIMKMRRKAVDRIRESFDIDASHRQIVDLCGLTT
jgi:hypothetical protein